MEQQVSTQAEKLGNIHDAEYSEFLRRFAAHFMASIDDGVAPLFTTDASGLWDAYLTAFDPGERGFHNCHACRHFIERFGSLVTLKDGVPSTPLWTMSDVPEPYRASFAAVAKIVSRAKVDGVFLSSEETWGHPETGKWRHFALWPKPVMLVKRARMTAGQVMAEKREERGMVSRAIAEFPRQLVEQAVAILKSDALYRSEKVLGQGEWLLKLHDAIAAAPGRRQNVIWSAVALAPSGFCHPRSSMIGTLLEDLERGLPFDDVARKFKDKMHPLQYQRPQADPSAGNIAQAEKIVRELGIECSLERRFARLEDITHALWRPRAQEEKSASEGVFAHLKPKDAAGPQPTITARQRITFEKFRRTALDGAIAIDILAPHTGNYCALVTAEHMDAPPILQWDTLENRNPVSWYLYHNGSNASRWGLAGGQWHGVDAVCLQPSMWNGGFEHQGDGVVFIIRAAKDSGSNLALFPEILKSELREIRATIEAYSRSKQLTGRDEASACGLILQKKSGSPLVVRVKTSPTVSSEYEIDRWD